MEVSRGNTKREIRTGVVKKKHWTKDLPPADKAIAPGMVEQEGKEEREKQQHFPQILERF